MCGVKVLIVNVSLSNKALKGHHRDEKKKDAGAAPIPSGSITNPASWHWIRQDRDRRLGNHELRRAEPVHRRPL